MLLFSLSLLLLFDVSLSIDPIILTTTSGVCPTNFYFYPGNLSCVECSFNNVTMDCGLSTVDKCPGIVTAGTCSVYCTTRAQNCIAEANDCLLTCSETENQCCQCQDFNNINLEYDDVINHLENNPVTKDFFVTGSNAEVLPIMFARFLRDGTFLGLSSNWNNFSPCTERESNINIGTLVGTNYFISCPLVYPTTDPVFIEAFIIQSNSLIPIPFYVKFANGNICYRRRIYQYRLASRELTFINAVQLNISFDANLKRIETPTFLVSYTSNISHSQSTLSISYSQDQTGINVALPITIIVLFFVSLVWVGIQINGWMRKTGRTFCDPVTFFMLFILSADFLSIIIFVVILAASSMLLLIYKLQSKLFFLIPQPHQEVILILLLTVSLLLQTMHVVYVLFLQCTADIFIIDWERTLNLNQHKVSIWRSYLIANEWLRLQTLRRVNLAPLLIILALLLVGIQLINISSSQPLTIVIPTDVYLAPTSRYMRVAVSSVLFLFIALVQFILTFFYERFVEDKLNQFVDLCSVSNISFIAFIYPRFGYYIHGRSVHGMADTDLRTLTQFFTKEEEDIVGNRGLDGSLNQVFEISLTYDLRHEYERIMRQAQLSRDSEVKKKNSNSLQESELLAHQMLTKLFTSFIEKSHKTFQFEKREKLLCERVTRIELYEPIEACFLYPNDSNCFSHLLYLGCESTLILFNLLTFQFWDTITLNTIAACFLTYCTDRILFWIRKVWAKHNIARKTLLDKRFLI